ALEEAPAVEGSKLSRPAELLLLSAKTGTALDQAARNLAGHLRENPNVNLADVAYTLHTGRHDFSHRRLLVGRDANDAANALEANDPKRIFTGSTNCKNPPVTFMFPGQGAQQVNMGLEIYQTEPVFREQVDVCCELLKPALGFDLRQMLYPGPERNEEAGQKLTQTAITQPALFVIEYALAKLWMSWGVRPNAMIGHSIGEYVAACLAGVFTLEDALQLVATRGRMMQQLPGGTMLAVRLSENELKPLLNEKISLAAVNAPSLCVVSGPTDAIELFERTLSQRDTAWTALRTSHAFHSAMMEPILPSFAGVVGAIKLNAPQIPFISNVTGTWVTAEQATDPNYWAKHLRQAVRFADGISELFKEPAQTVLEVGPGRTLGNLAKQHPARGAGNAVVPSLSHAKGSETDMESLLNAVGRLWLSGVE
ncbi:MAG TPA: acyltransferase domain-containing protein, partial [Candidatus Binatia bacterium]|nr:acyltransferase domain-containing protein [Candidatus Binatia bacterium]